MGNKKIVQFSSYEDDFANTHIQTRPVGENYTYVRKNPVWRIASFVLYDFIALPLVELITRIAFGIRYENTAALKQMRGKGFFLYGTHTHWVDVFISHMLAVRAFGRGHIIAGPDAVSIPGLKTLVELLGTIPIPDTLQGQKEMLRAVETLYEEKHVIAMYPEAHIWPYYNGVRPFSPVSFTYPARLDAPVIAHASFYRKSRWRKRPAITVKISDPIYPDMSLPLRKRKEKLRDQVYEFFCRSTEGSYEYIRYEEKQAE